MESSKLASDAQPAAKMGKEAQEDIIDGAAIKDATSRRRERELGEADVAIASAPALTTDDPARAASSSSTASPERRLKSSKADEAAGTPEARTSKADSPAGSEEKKKKKTVAFAEAPEEGKAPPKSAKSDQTLEAADKTEQKADAVGAVGGAVGGAVVAAVGPAAISQPSILVKSGESKEKENRDVKGSKDGGRKRERSPDERRREDRSDLVRSRTAREDDGTRKPRSGLLDFDSARGSEDKYVHHEKARRGEGGGGRGMKGKGRERREERQGGRKGV